MKQDVNLNYDLKERTRSTLLLSFSMILKFSMPKELESLE